ncbi:MAG: DUF805 domain-containing protein [Pseudomonadota bacterium]|nr:DUF805 domain-containing protein [Pseudomonadota bacterium]MEE3098850.1 DUF805 domain-containing protein [Pseudomonadota bacterium]
MTFGEAISRCLGDYAEFSGRSSRAEFWLFALFHLLCVAGAAALDLAFTLGMGAPAPLCTLLTWLALLLPGAAVQVRRLHDVGRGGRWLALAVVPLIGPAALLMLYLMPGEPEANRFGPPAEQRDGLRWA